MDREHFTPYPRWQWLLRYLFHTCLALPSPPLHPLLPFQPQSIALPLVSTPDLVSVVRLLLQTPGSAFPLLDTKRPCSKGHLKLYLCEIQNQTLHFPLFRVIPAAQALLRGGHASCQLRRQALALLQLVR